MRKITTGFFIILVSIIFTQSEHPYPPLNLVSIPTGGTMPRGSYTIEILLQKEGGVLPKLAVGLTNHFTIGMSYGIKKMIGVDKPEVNRSKPEVQIKYRLFEETESRPAIVIGLDTQGKGDYRDSVRAIGGGIGVGRLEEVNRYNQKAWGLYFVMSKNWEFLGNFGAHLGLSKNSWENTDGDDDLDFFFGFDKEINRSFAFLIEYDAAMNDNQEKYEWDEISFGRGSGYLNAAFRWTMATNLLLEISFNDINKSTKADYTNREIKIMYSEMF